MTLFKSKGIVFRATKYSESSLILDIFTREKGLRSFIVSGVRSSKSKAKASLYQHLNVLDLVAYDKEDKLARIKECSLDHHYQHLVFDVVRSSVGLFMLEVCKNAIKEREENTPLYDFIYKRLLLLDDGDCPNISLFSIKFLLELTSYIGFMPQNNYSKMDPYFDLYNGIYVDQLQEKYCSSRDVSEAIAMIDRTPINELGELSFSRSMRNLIIDDLVIYYRLHIENFKPLNTLDVLRTIF